MSQSRVSMSSSFVSALAGTVAGPEEEPDVRVLREPVQLMTWLEAVDRRLQLPDSAQAFAVVVAGLALFIAGAFLLMMPAVSILEARAEIVQLQQTYTALEQQNSDLIFTIGREMNMDRLRQRALEQGYTAIQAREYVYLPAEVGETTLPPEPLLAAGAPVPPAQGEGHLGAAQANWRSWEALFGFGRPAQPAAAADARWDIRWPEMPTFGEGRDFPGRWLEQWSGR